ncbi:hypothetical protein C8J56DRAFT_1045593 [Mycena floridula]|nr:hypothetical protein C8J56DRAFT_1045593 [Mycena floridula]
MAIPIRKQFPSLDYVDYTPATIAKFFADQGIMPIYFDDAFTWIRSFSGAMASYLHNNPHQASLFKVLHQETLEYEPPVGLGIGPKGSHYLCLPRPPKAKVAVIPVAKSTGVIRAHSTRPKDAQNSQDLATATSSALLLDNKMDVCPDFTPMPFNPSQFGRTYGLNATPISPSDSSGFNPNQPSPAYNPFVPSTIAPTTKVESIDEPGIDLNLTMGNSGVPQISEMDLIEYDDDAPGPDTQELGSGYPKRKRERDNAAKETRGAPAPPAGAPDSEDDDEDPSTNEPTKYSDSQALFSSLRDKVKEANAVFSGCYSLDPDESISDRERTRISVQEVWAVTGYRFRIQDHKSLNPGHKCQFWCCQDVNHKQREHRSTKPGRTVRIFLRHAETHLPYYDVGLPGAVADIIWENLDKVTLSTLVTQIQQEYPAVTAAQIHRAWSTMSETVWKRDQDQLTSARILLKEFDDIDYFTEMAEPEEGIERLCFGLKPILNGLRGKIVKIGLDATYNTNSSNLELYSIMGEYDNTGFLLTYCLLTTAQAVGIGKRKRALEAWAKVLRDKYGIIA